MGAWLLKDVNLEPPEVFFIWKVQSIGELEPEDIKTFDSEPLMGRRSRDLTSQGGVFISRYIQGKSKMES